MLRTEVLPLFASSTVPPNLLEVLSRFRCLLQIRGRCAVDPTSSERVKTFSYMRSNDDFRFHFQYTSTSQVALQSSSEWSHWFQKFLCANKAQICPTFVMVCLSPLFQYVSQLHSSSLEAVVESVVILLFPFNLKRLKRRGWLATQSTPPLRISPWPHCLH